MDFAVSASDALARVASNIEQPPILILSDINMPGMTGLEMLPRKKEMQPDVPVIMITAYGDPETKRKATAKPGLMLRLEMQNHLTRQQCS
jgi:CheY-like chemotaxis protein